MEKRLTPLLDILLAGSMGTNCIVQSTHAHGLTEDKGLRDQITGMNQRIVENQEMHFVNPLSG
jgi:hypothetical protein